MALELTDATFQAAALDTDKAVLIDFSAEWCGPCKMMAPIINELSSEYEGKAVVAKIDVDANPNVSSQFKIRSLPTFMVIKNGEVKEKMIGVTSKKKLAEKLDAHI